MLVPPERVVSPALRFPTKEGTNQVDVHWLKRKAKRTGDVNGPCNQRGRWWRSDVAFHSRIDGIDSDNSPMAVRFHVSSTPVICPAKKRPGPGPSAAATRSVIGGNR